MTNDILILKHYEKEEFSVRSTKDRRLKVDRYVVSYVDVTNEEYRKSFEVKPKGKPNIPASGTHKELNATKYQH